MCAGITANSILFMFLCVGLLQVDAIIRSIMLMMLQRLLVKVLVPCAENCYDEQWRVGVFVVVCATELPPALLLADVTLRSITFWLLVVLQEGNALLKNLGIYYGLYCRAMGFIGRLVGEDPV